MKCPWCRKSIENGQTVCDNVNCAGPIKWGPGGPVRGVRPLTLGEQAVVVLGGTVIGVVLAVLIMAVSEYLLGFHLTDRWEDAPLLVILVCPVVSVWVFFHLIKREKNR